MDWMPELNTQKQNVPNHNGNNIISYGTKAITFHDNIAMALELG